MIHVVTAAIIKWALVISILGTIATLILGYIHESGIDDLKAKIGVLEERITVMKVDGRLSDLEKKFAETKVEDRLTDPNLKREKK